MVRPVTFQGLLRRPGSPSGPGRGSDRKKKGGSSRGEGRSCRAKGGGGGKTLRPGLTWKGGNDVKRNSWEKIRGRGGGSLKKEAQVIRGCVGYDFQAYGDQGKKRKVFRGGKKST